MQIRVKMPTSARYKKQNLNKSIATIINLDANEKKKQARGSNNILKDAEQVAKGLSENMDIGQ